MALPIAVGLLPRDPRTPRPESRTETAAMDFEAHYDAELATLFPDNPADETSPQSSSETGDVPVTRLTCMSSAAMARWQQLKLKLLELEESVM